METKKITVNKSPERPNGVEIEVVVPKDDLEIQVLSYLLEGFLRDAHTGGKLKVELPERYALSYQNEGSFLVSAAPGTGSNANGSPYYSPARPLAIIAIQRFGRRFDLAYAEIKQAAFNTQKPAEDAQPATTK